MKNSRHTKVFIASAMLISIFGNIAHAKLPGQCSMKCPEGKECRFANPKNEPRYEYCGTIKNGIKTPSITDSFTQGSTPEPNSNN